MCCARRADGCCERGRLALLLGFGNVPARPEDPLVAVGIDGAPAGWVAACLYADALRPEDAAVWQTRLELFVNVDELAAFRDAAGAAAPVAIDVPIGLLDSVDFRPCDVAARQLLKKRVNRPGWRGEFWPWRIKDGVHAPGAHSRQADDASVFG